MVQRSYYEGGNRSDAATRGEVAFLIGNTKAMWPKFILWLRRQAGIPEDPIDFYSKTNIVRIIENIVSAHTHTVRKK